MRTGTVHVHHRNRVHPRIKGSSSPANQLPRPNASRTRAAIRLAPSEVRATAKSLRELLLWDLREEGYTFREIGELFRMTKQRASQIERRMIVRASSRAFSRSSASPRQHFNVRSDAPTIWIRSITRDEFEDRLNKINSLYEEQFSRIVERGYRRQRSCKHRSGDQTASEFWRVWPLIEAYGKRPFCYSRLTTDFPQLANEPHLAQYLSRLRRTGLLEKVGTVRIEGYNRPEILMTQAPVEQHVTSAIERLVAKWSKQLRRLEQTRRPRRLRGSLDTTRSHLIDSLLRQGVPLSEIAQTFGSTASGLSSNGPLASNTLSGDSQS